MERGIRKNSFEDHDRSLDNFLYMNGNLQSNENKKIRVYKWNNESNSNELVWEEREQI